MIDLGGRELGGELPGTSTNLVLRVPGLVLRNGTLNLPRGACVRLAADGVALDCIKLKGTGPEGGTWTVSCERMKGLVVVESSGVALEG